MYTKNDGCYCLLTCATHHIWMVYDHFSLCRMCLLLFQRTILMLNIAISLTSETTQNAYTIYDQAQTYGLARFVPG